MSRLEELGLQEVSKKTHIEVKHLQWMMEKKFEKLNRINTLGFAKILIREYNLDLDEWLKEFNDHWAENHKDTGNAKIFVTTEYEEPKRKWPLFLILLLIAIITTAWYFDAKKYINTLYNENNEKNVSHLYNMTPSVEKAKESLNLDANISEEINTTKSEEINPFDVEETTEQNSTLLTKENIVQEETNTVVEESVEEIVEENISKETQNEIKVDTITSNFSIKPDIKIWVGIIYLKDMKRDSYLTTDTIKLDPTREQIITTGHGRFILTANDENQSFNSEFPKRYYLKNGDLKEITYDEFIAYNKGKAW